MPKADPTQRWSYSLFGNDWNSARIIGTIIRKVGEKFIVKFDVDSEEQACESSNLAYEKYDTPFQQVLPTSEGIQQVY